MKFCQKCGKEIMDDAVVCVGCGCSVQSDQRSNVNLKIDEFDIFRRKMQNKRMIVIGIVAICVAVVLLFASIAIFNSVRANRIIEELSGESFEYVNYNAYSIRRERYSFDEKGNLEEYSYSYGPADDEPNEYTFTQEYTIKFEGDTAHVVLRDGIQLEIRYDKNGEIDSLYMPAFQITYEKE